MKKLHVCLVPGKVKNELTVTGILAALLSDLRNGVTILRGRLRGATGNQLNEVKRAFNKASTTYATMFGSRRATRSAPG